jgi:hypothetical protein
MKDVVLIPIYFRPEYLQICLEKLSACRGIQEKQIWLLQDNHPNDEYTHKLEADWTHQVINSWRGTLDLQFFLSDVHMTDGNSRNVLEGYKRAYAANSRYVYLIEDDVLVTNDFFDWHERMQDQGDFFCTVGSNCFWHNREKICSVRDPSAYYIAKSYGSYGVCWKPKNMKTFLQYAIPAYYLNMLSYLHERLGGTPLGDIFTEQDGLIERCIWLSDKKAAFPYVSRAIHAGYYGYHRSGMRPNGFLKDKIDGLRTMIEDPKTLDNPINNPHHDMESYPKSADFGAWNDKLHLEEL